MNKVSGILALLIAICVGTALLNDAFVKPYNMENGLRWSALFGIIGIGVAFVIITGGIDLSIGSMIGLTGCLLPMLLVDYGWSVPTSLLVVMLLATGLGFVHGMLITKLHLQPFIVTLCGLLIYRGLARTITGDQTKGFGADFDSLRLLATGKPCSVALLILLGGMVLLIWSHVRWWHHQENDNAPARRPAAIAGLFIGLMLLLVGASRYWSGFDIDTGPPVVSIGALELPTWSVNVSKTPRHDPEQ